MLLNIRTYSSRWSRLRKGKPVPIRLSASLSRRETRMRRSLRKAPRPREAVEKLIAGRVVDDGLRDQVSVAQRDRDRILREPVDEVRRPVERVDDPRVLRVAARAGLFRQHGVVGVGLEQHLDDRALGRMIHLGATKSLATQNRPRRRDPRWRG